MPNPPPFQGKRLHLVTGKIAEPALARMVEDLAPGLTSGITLQVLPITVAALMTPAWIARHIEVPDATDVVVIPGYANGDLQPLVEVCPVPVVVGPRDMRRLPEWLGGRQTPVSLDDYSIEVIAEINHAPRLSIEAIVAEALALGEAGADVIDLGCEPDGDWAEAGIAVRELVDRGFRVSIDSLQPREIQRAVDAGAELVLSVNASNRRAAVDWDTEVVVIPDVPNEWMAMDTTIDWLVGKRIPFRIDPILEPVGTGFTASLHRYIEARHLWQDAPMMMGIGNLTELSDVDSAGINFLLLAICEELEIGSVLTTQVINWARTSVRECDMARRIVHAALSQRVPAKHLSEALVCLRDPRVDEFSSETLAETAERIRDNNYRIAVANDTLHLMGGKQHWRDTDPYALFQKLMDTAPRNVDAGHAFYLGFELCKAAIARQLGKQYEQDEALRWGYLTEEVTTHRRIRKSKRSENDSDRRE